MPAAAPLEHLATHCPAPRCAGHPDWQAQYPKHDRGCPRMRAPCAPDLCFRVRGVSISYKFVQCSPRVYKKHTCCKKRCQQQRHWNIWQHIAQHRVARGTLTGKLGTQNTTGGAPECAHRAHLTCGSVRAGYQFHTNSYNVHRE